MPAPPAALISSDVERTVEFMYKLKRRLNRILAHHCGKTPEVIERDADRDNYMSAEEAAAYGLVDKVLPAIGVPPLLANDAIGIGPLRPPPTTSLGWAHVAP